MNTTCTWHDFEVTANLDVQITFSETSSGHTAIHVAWDQMTQEKPELVISWQMPNVDIQHTWYPDCGKNRGMSVTWRRGVTSCLACSAPAFVFFNSSGVSRQSVALSDVFTEINVLAGICEETGMLVFKATIPLDATNLTHAYHVMIYRNAEPVSFAKALRSISHWWEDECGLTPMAVPAAATQPMYSTWYSYHQNTIAHSLEAECQEAVKLGMHSIIVDDGWQTSDGNRGYGYCGDWSVACEKIPDMAAHVQRIHDLGMKYMLWYSVPFIGEYSSNWKRFEDKLSDRYAYLHCGVLDPRYPECREFLIQTYVNALQSWNLDGFKLDFIDAFPPSSEAPMPTAGMDYVKVEDAVLRLMTDIKNALYTLKPDVLIEFRQRYIGPAMRTYGNMFRVADCPLDPLSNRVGMVDLRLLSGNTAIHSDMLMWRYDEPVEVVVRQLLNVLFAVPQISVRLSDLPPDHQRMLSFWMHFMTEHQALLHAEMEVEAPELLYPLVRTQSENQEAIAVYSQNHIAKLSNASISYVFNATGEQGLYVSLPDGKKRSVQIYNCLGDLVNETTLSDALFHQLMVPMSGFAVFTAASRMHDA